MKLTTYRRKRQFSTAPEPRGIPTSKMATQSLHFVVQKHAASNLHYDFRLELDDVFKSWAIPKGPSMSPHDKRLAIMTEDHPLNYQKFERVIPPSNYGAGKVVIWDQGTYGAVDGGTRKQQEQKLRAGLEIGYLKFVLHGQNLKGEFALIRLKRDEQNWWLFIKKTDQYTAADGAKP